MVMNGMKQSFIMLVQGGGNNTAMHFGEGWQWERLAPVSNQMHLHDLDNIHLFIHSSLDFANVESLASV